MEEEHQRRASNGPVVWWSLLNYLDASLIVRENASCYDSGTIESNAVQIVKFEEQLVSVCCPLCIFSTVDYKIGLTTLVFFQSYH